MARRRRCSDAGYVYHVLNRAVGRATLFDTQADYAALLARRDEVRAIYAKTAGRYDAVVMLAATGAAPLGLTSTGDTSMNVAASLLGVPALSLPLLEDQKLPLGLQLMGLARQDAALFHVAAWTVRAAFARPDPVGEAE